MRNSLLTNLKKEIESKLYTKLSHSSSLNIIMDIWSSKSMDGYIGFTCSAVTQDFEKFVVFLGLRKMTGRHTSQAILAEYEQLLINWKLSSAKVLVDNS